MTKHTLMAQEPQSSWAVVAGLLIAFLICSAGLLGFLYSIWRQRYNDRRDGGIGGVQSDPNEMPRSLYSIDDFPTLECQIHTPHTPINVIYPWDQLNKTDN